MENGYGTSHGNCGIFFRARDPKALARWYDEYLGVSLTPTSQGGEPWTQQAGPTVFEPFPENTDYFGNASKVWMLNFRVKDLDKMVKQLQTAGISVEANPEDPNGRFARLYDPEENPIELWQPEG